MSVNFHKVKSAWLDVAETTEDPERQEAALFAVDVLDHVEAEFERPPVPFEYST